ncbi:hypothetical protein MHBO_003689 [Bonamia ostreae]|uniref:Uncharacterized protein n=1 Tax=Bonamia ostreae TaxID=126728 RepID=A0ABV2AR62_9EUKA
MSQNRPNRRSLRLPTDNSKNLRKRNVLKSVQKIAIGSIHSQSRKTKRVSIIIKLRTTIGIKDIDEQDIELSLKHGAFEIFKDDNLASDSFFNQNIDEILSQRAITLNHTENKSLILAEENEVDLDMTWSDIWNENFYQKLKTLKNLKKLKRKEVFSKKLNFSSKYILKALETPKMVEIRTLLHYCRC